MDYIVYKDSAEEYRWRITAANGKIIGAATEGYTNRVDCVYNMQILKNALNEIEEIK